LLIFVDISSDLPPKNHKIIEQTRQIKVFPWHYSDIQS